MKKQTRILVTGASGFLGSHVIEELKRRGYKNIFSPEKEDDLRNYAVADKVLLESGADVVVHLAAKVGGIMENIKAPAEFFYDNISMATNIIHASYVNNIKKLVYVGTVCSYPDKVDLDYPLNSPLTEKMLFEGLPEESNRSYGLSKRVAIPMLQAYRKQYGFNGVVPILTNLYGPGDKSTHVVPDMIRKFKASNDEPIKLWGSGEATREFLYVKDAVSAIIDIMEKYNDPEPLNIGSGVETSIRELAELVASLTKFKGTIIWDTDKPEGNKRRFIDSTRARQVLGWSPKTSLREGIKEML